MRGGVDRSKWDQARLIPTAGIGGPGEQERRAASALLAVLSVVTEFQRALLKPLGAPKGRVEAFCEVVFPLDQRRPDGKSVRPDGLIEIRRGKKEWSILVEVKTGNNDLERGQVEQYLQVARTYDIEGGLLTVSNQIVPVKGHHPVKVNKQKYGRVPLHHLSWTRILTQAVLVKEHHGVNDPEQAWILGELVRYLTYEKSGVLSFAHMGPNWAAVRKALRKRNPLTEEQARDVAMRWDQFLQYLCLDLTVQLGEVAAPLFSRKERKDPALRTTKVIQMIREDGELSGSVEIPHAAGPIELIVNLESGRAMAQIELDAPNRKTAKGRLGWLTRQLGDVPKNRTEDRPVSAEDLDILAFYPYRSVPHTASLHRIRADPMHLLRDRKLLPKAFTVKLTRKVGMTMKKGPGGFVSDLERLLRDFYGEVVQGLHKWTPPAPRLPKEPEVKEDSEKVVAEASGGVPD
jgi:hypothetical protein